VTSPERDPAPILEYVAGTRRCDGNVWVNQDGEALDTIDKPAAHLAAADAAAVANGHRPGRSLLHPRFILAR